MIVTFPVTFTGHVHLLFFLSEKCKRILHFSDKKTQVKHGLDFFSHCVLIVNNEDSVQNDANSSKFNVSSIYFKLS